MSVCLRRSRALRPRRCCERSAATPATAPVRQHDVVPVQGEGLAGPQRRSMLTGRPVSTSNGSPRLAAERRSLRNDSASAREVKDRERCRFATTQRVLYVVPLLPACFFTPQSRIS